MKITCFLMNEVCVTSFLILISRVLHYTRLNMDIGCI